MKNKLSFFALIRIWTMFMLFNIAGCFASIITATLVNGVVVTASTNLKITIDTLQYFGGIIGTVLYLIFNIFSLKFTLNHKYKNIDISINEK